MVRDAALAPWLIIASPRCALQVEARLYDGNAASFREDLFRNYLKRGTSDAPTPYLAGIRRPEWTERRGSVARKATQWARPRLF
jgi:hypothetical protein